MKKIKKSLVKTPVTNNLFDRVVSILDQARNNVIRAVNNNMALAYWLIGREIVQELQYGEERAEYGTHLLENLSKQLAERYGEGFSVPNLRNFRQFYLTFKNRNPIIHYPMGSELETQEKYYPTGSKSLQSFHPNLTWSHYRALLQLFAQMFCAY